MAPIRDGFDLWPLDQIVCGNQEVSVFPMAILLDIAPDSS
jgi:hypothetical protein